MPDNAKASQQLIASLDAYLEDRGTKPVGQTEGAIGTVVAYSFWDRVWIGILLAGLLAFASLLPETIFKDERYKAYVDKLLTWFIAGGFFGQWFKSPQNLLTLSQTSAYRWSTGVFTGICFVLVFVVVQVDAVVKPTDATVVVDDKPVGPSFRTSVRTLGVRVVDKDGTHPRSFTLSAPGMLWAFLHPRPVWWLVYEVTFICPQPQCPVPSTLDLSLTDDGGFDGEVERGLIRDGLGVYRPPKTQGVTQPVRVQVTLKASRQVSLPAGDYQVALTKDRCTDEQQPLSVTGVRSYDVVSEKCR